MHLLCPRSQGHFSLSRGLAAYQSLVRFFSLHQIKLHALRLVQAPANSFKFHSCESTPQAGLIIHQLQHYTIDRHSAQYPSFMARTTGVSNPICSLAFSYQCQYLPRIGLLLLVFFSISMHFIASQKIPSTLTVLQLYSFHRLSRVELQLEKPPTDALCPIIPDNICIRCLTGTTAIEVADAYFSDTTIFVFSEKRSSRPMGFLPLHNIAPLGH